MNPKSGRWLRRIVPVLYAVSLGALPLAAVAGTAAAAPVPGSGGGSLPIYNPKLEHQWFYGQRLQGTGLTPPQAAQSYAQALRQAQGMTRSALSPQGPAPAGIPPATDTWQNLGPAPVTGTQDWSGSQAASGRVSSIALSGSTLYLGAAGGGVWSSTNNGASWTPLTDGQPSLAMGAVAVDPNNPSVIYAGTGEAHESGDSFYGEGLLKSTDGGTSWSVYGATYFAGSYIAAVVVNPLHSSDVYVAGNMGLYESTDAGNTWAKVGPWGNYWVTALVINPTNGDLYAAVEGKGIEESTDGGSTWTLLSNGVFSGLNFGNTALSIDAANPQILVASVAGTTRGGAVYETTDGGASWSNLNAPPYFWGSYFYGSGSADQSWYDNTVAVDPANSSIIFAGGIAVVETTNDGGSWSCVNCPGEPLAFHPDQHAMLFDSSGDLYVGNDGGIWEITAAGTSSQALVDLNTNLSNLQFYPGLSQEGNGAVITGGSQDNGSEEYTGSTAWPELYGGDGSGTVVNPGNSNDILVSADEGIYYNFGTGSGPSAVWTNVTPNGGMSSNWVTPVVLDPNSVSGTVLTGGNNLYEATDVWSATGSSLTWTKLTATTNVSTYGDVSAIAVAPGESNVIYVGYSSGTVIMTTNGGASWSNITPTSIDRWVTSITVSPANPYQVYLTLSGAGMPQSQPSLPHVLYTADANVSTPTWTDISGNLPDAPVNSLVLDGSSVIVASDVGVFVTADAGQSWSALGSGLPNTQVVQLVLTSNGVLLAATHGRGVWMISVSAPPAAATTVTGLSPNSGPLAGGTSVVVTGTDFTDVTAVDFGGAPAASYTVVSSTQIAAVSPPTSVAGSVYVTVTAAGGISPDSSDGSFQYASTATGFSLWSLSPGAAPAGSSLSLYGNDFGTVGGSVYFTQSSNTVAASTYWSDTEVTTTVPPVSSSLSPGNVSAAVYSDVNGLSNSLPFTLIGPPRSVSVSVSATSVPADGTTSSQLTATVTDVNGNPVPDTLVGFNTTLGTLSASSAVTNASGVATDTITSTKTGTATVTATASGVSGTATVTFTAGAPAKVAVSAAPSSVPADGSTASTVTATVTDKYGNPVPGTPVGFGTTLGSLSATTVATNADGQAQVTITSTKTGTATVTATAGGVSGSATVTFTPGAPAKVAVSAAPSSVPADGTTSSTVTTTVTDVNGNPVPGTPVDFSTTLGTLSATTATTDASGVATDTITSSAAGTATVTATASGVSDTATVTFTSVAPTGCTSCGGGGGGGAPAPSPTSTSPTNTSASASVTTAGGTVATADNSVVLNVPPGAFTATVTVSISAVSQASAPPAPRGFTAAAVWSMGTGGVEPTKPVQASFKYDPSLLKGLNADRLGVYLYDPGTGTWAWVGGVVDPATGTITVTLSHFSIYGVLANTATFNDLSQASWARTAVDTLLGANMVAGVAPGVFDPNGTLTRAQFATLLVKADGLAPVTSGKSPFTDVSPAAWYAPYVAAAYNAGLVSGVSSTTPTFDPNGSITREQMALMLAKLLGSSAPTGSLSRFSDASSIAPWAQSGVAAAVGAGLMTGFQNGTFQPTGLSTRAQAAAVLAKYLSYVGKV
jgi:hypothetical protein